MPRRPDPYEFRGQPRPPEDVKRVWRETYGYHQMGLFDDVALDPEELVSSISADEVVARKGGEAVVIAVAEERRPPGRRPGYGRGPRAAVSLRIDPALYERVVQAAVADGVSINTWIERAVETAVDQRPSS